MLELLRVNRDYYSELAQGYEEEDFYD